MNYDYAFLLLNKDTPLSDTTKPWPINIQTILGWLFLFQSDI